MSLTPAQVRLAMIPLVRRLAKGGHPISSFDGVAPDLGQLTLLTPAGYAMPVVMPVTLAALVPLDAYVADAETRIRQVMAAFETEVRPGFNWSARTLQPGEASPPPNAGWT